MTTHVTIVSSNPETLDGLRRYLVSVGVPCSAVADVTRVAGGLPEDASAAVIFPDDFADDDVLQLVRELRRLRPMILVLLVTSHLRRFSSVLEPPPIVLPRSSFGWDILDALRAHAESLDP
jgi:DNA-binding NtrC family response regulator